MRLPRLLKRYLQIYPQWGFDIPRVQVTRDIDQFGSTYGGYFMDMSVVPRDPVIYSLGVGKDISFDLTLITKHGFTIHAFDPTPEVKDWVAEQSLPTQFHFHPFGIANFDGEADFHLPPRSDFISHSMVAAQQYSKDSIRLPVMTLLTAMKTLGHGHIDVLKMDVEGAEYGILSDLIQQRINIRQILVEFHHRLSSMGVHQTKSIISALNEYGMDISYICPRLEIFTLFRNG